MEFVWIPEGHLHMGSDLFEDDLEKPVHCVSFAEGFFIGKFTVTERQWGAVMYDHLDRLRFDDKMPVDEVTWDEAQRFILKLNELDEEYSYRLPSEAEWEYACRADTTSEFAFGETLTSAQANLGQDFTVFPDFHKKASREVYEQRGYKMTGGGPLPTKVGPIPVGSFEPNAFGLYDMHGNVWEWCEDWFHENYEGAPEDGSAWLTGGKQTSRVLRGGSYLGYLNGRVVRSAGRFAAPPDLRGCAGVRLVAMKRLPK
jgi:formylglycine-generating enzyme required for sulfatase activity